MVRWVAGLVGSLGYIGVALLMAIENVVLPLPSELIMPLAGFASGTGRMTLWGVILAGTIGSVVGALPVYAFARSVGEERISRWIEAHGRWLLLRGKDIKKADNRLKQHAGRAVVLSQLVPGARGLIAIPAGFARMNVTWFALANFIGTVIWCTVLAVAGNVLGSHYTKVEHVLGPIGYVVLAAIAIGSIVWLMRRRGQRSQSA